MSRQTRYAEELTRLAETLGFDVQRTRKNEWMAKDRASKGIVVWPSTSVSASGFLNARARLRRVVRGRERLD